MKLSLKHLLKFSISLRESDFKRNFGDNLGAHLHQKFTKKYNYCPIYFWDSLDPQNKVIFEKMVENFKH